MGGKTVFAKIIDKEIPADIVFEDDRCIAFRDIQPAAPTHILVIPKKPIAMAEDVTPADEAVLGHLIVVAAQIAQKEGLTDGYRLMINNGEHAGQTVFHLHLHLLGGRQLGSGFG